MLDLDRAHARENFRMRRARCGEAGLDIGVEAKGKARQRHAVYVSFVWIERHTVLGVRELFHLRGEAKVARGVVAQRAV